MNDLILLRVLGERSDVNQLAPNYTIGVMPGQNFSDIVGQTSRHALGNFDYVKRAVLYPGGTLPPCPPGTATNGCSKTIHDSTLALLHFSAYILGANCIQMLPDRETVTKRGFSWGTLTPGERISTKGCYSPP
eukprot:COSAG06_NODE_156_length_21863_cov_29.245405_7_plen_133_part_00